MELTDTHCHIHSTFYKLDPDKVIKDAQAAGVTKAICVGTSDEDSVAAIEFVSSRPNLWASIGIHPHDAKHYSSNKTKLATFAGLVDRPKVIAVGECGLDYYYNHSPKDDQRRLLRFQIELGLASNLPMIFHVRDAFEDFWKVFDSYKEVKGVVHSFSATQKELDQILDRQLYVGLNGIMTFSKKSEQLAAAKAVPLDKMVLETDAPFLTPAPYRGTIAQLKHLRVTAEFLADLRGETLGQIAAATTLNANSLFGLS